MTKKQVTIATLTLIFAIFIAGFYRLHIINQDNPPQTHSPGVRNGAMNSPIKPIDMDYVYMSTVVHDKCIWVIAKYKAHPMVMEHHPLCNHKGGYYEIK